MLFTLSEKPNSPGEAADLTGKVLSGSYQISKVVGRGGMGTVYQAQHLRLPKKVAIKVLDRSAAGSAGMVRFEREALVTTEIGNPHIVEVLDFDKTDDGLSFIVMELLEGEDLRQRLMRGPLGVEAAIAVVTQAAAGLEAAHERGVVHRDLKPSNLFLCRRGKRDDYVKLLDFGISKILGASARVTQTHSAIGTPAYMCPEQAAGGAAAVDHRADIYALGAITFEMLTGALPFGGDSIPELMFKIVYDPPPRLTDSRPDLPALESVILRALAKQPEDRFDSAAAFAEALSREAGVQTLSRIPTEDHSVHWATGHGATGHGATGPQEPAAVDRGAETAAAPAPSVSPPAPSVSPLATTALHAGFSEDSTATETATLTASKQPARSAPGPAIAAAQPLAAATTAARTTLSTSTGELAAGSAPRTDLRWIPLAVSVGLLLISGAIFAALIWPDDPPASAAAGLTHVSPDGSAATDVGAAPGDSGPDGDSAPDDSTMDHSAVADAAPPAPDAARAAARPDAARKSPRRRPLRRRRIARVRIATKAEGGAIWADVRIDGKPRGQTPLVVSLPVGRHRLELRRAGYVTVTRSLVVRRGSQRHLIELRRR